MTWSRVKLRGIAAMGLLALPYAILFAVGSIWLYQYHGLVWWGIVSLAATLMGWYLLKGLHHAPGPPLVQPTLAWPPVGVAAWKEVETLSARIEAENLPLDQPEKLWDVVRRVVDAVARHYHPQSRDPWLEIPLPHVLRIMELALGDLRRATLGYVPGAHILTIADLRRLQKLAGVANRSYFWYRIISFAINSPAALVREARDAAFGQLTSGSAETLKRWAVGFFVRRTGYYAIELYGRYLTLDDALAPDALGRQSRQDMGDYAGRAEALEKEPLRMLIVGQKKAGKSSLINALFGAYRAATDVIPRTQHVEPYVLEREGLPQVIVFDTAGYDAGAQPPALGPLMRHMRGCDLVVCVCSASSAARQADRQYLDALRTEFQQNRDRHPPVILAALTQIDRLRPVTEWNPPYRLAPPEDSKARQIAEAVEAVAGDLGLPPGDVIPVCTLPERAYYNVEEALVPRLLQRLPEALRVKCLRVLRQQHAEATWRRLWQQTVQAGRVVLNTLGDMR
jgi:uncharacterized protein